MPRQPRLPPAGLRSRSWLWCAGLLALTACEGSDPVATPTAEVRGEILYPPTSGTVTFQAMTGQNAGTDLVQFMVRPDGQYVVNFPRPAELSAPGSLDVLPVFPSVAALGLQSGTCASAVQAQPQGAQLALVRQGTFAQAGTVHGQILPAAQVLGSMGPQNLSVTTRQYLYADRAMQVTGQFGCTFRTAAGLSLPAQVEVDYALSPGWNVLTEQTGLEDQGRALHTRFTAQPGATRVQWRYWPSGQ